MYLDRDFQVRQQQINERLMQRELERQLALADRPARVHQFPNGAHLLRRFLSRSLGSILRFGAMRFPAESTEPC